MKKRKEFFFKHYKLFIVIVLIIFFIFLNLQIINKIDGPITFNEILSNINISETVSTITIIIGAVVAWVELYNSDRLNEASFIKDLNEQFIENKEMVEVEHALEMYFNRLDRGEQDVSINIDLRQDYEDRQKLINYLVYLEGLASIVSHDTVRINQINDLFGYRFFLAINNPVVQMLELYPYANYYQGIFKIYDKWMEFCKNKNSEDAMQIPLNDYKLKSSSYTIDGNKEFKLNPRIRKANINDDFKKIADILYETDSEIYPIAFGKDKEEATNNMAKLICKETGLFSYHNILVATTKEKVSTNFYQEVIKGVMLYCDGNKDGLWDINNVLENIQETPELLDVSKKYFSKYEKDNNVCKIIAIAVDKKYRGQKFGFFMLCTFSNMYCNKEIELEVLENNKLALNKYKQLLFIEKETIEGYSINEEKPRCLVLRRSPLCITKEQRISL